MLGGHFRPRCPECNSTLWNHPTFSSYLANGTERVQTPMPTEFFQEGVQHFRIILECTICSFRYKAIYRFISISAEPVEVDETEYGLPPQTENVYPENWRDHSWNLDLIRQEEE